MHRFGREYLCGVWCYCFYRLDFEAAQAELPYTNAFRIRLRRNVFSL